MSDQKRILKYGVNSGLAVVILAGILIAVNTIGTQFFGRLDLTEGQEFTISSSTKRILKNLDDVVQVKVFFSKKLPPQLATLEQSVADLLKEYEVYSKGKIKVRFLDPGASEDLKGQARSMGIPELQMNVLEKDQYAVSNVYLGIGIQYGDKTQSIPTVEDASALEYDLSRAIVKLTAKSEPVVAFLTGNSEKALDKDYQGLKRGFEAQYQVRPIDLSQGRTTVPEDVTTLIVAGSKNVPDRVKYELDQFLMRGGKLVYLVDAIAMNEMAGLQAYPNRSGLDDLLKHYGVEVKQALALDVRNALASFSQGYLAYTTPYPMWPKVTQQADGLSRENPISSRLESVTLPWTAPLEVNVAIKAPEKGKKNPAALASGTNLEQPNVQAVVLARTTEKAWTQTGRYDLNPQAALTTPATPTGQPMPLAVLLSGSFSSFYKGKAVPPKPTEPAPEGEEAPPALASTETALTDSPESQILVVGNSQFVSDQFLRMFPENALFIENAIDFLSRGDELIAIRSRGATERPLKPLSEGGKAAVKWLNTLGVPALIVAFGMIRRMVRQKQREQVAITYRQSA